MSEKKWREVTLDDLREMTQAERRLCRVRIGDVARGVYALDEGDVIWTLRKGLTRDWTEYELEHWDAVIEAPQPPPRPLPTHQGAVIRLGSDIFYLVTYVFQDGAWWEHDEIIETDIVQARANKYGWVELVPAVGPDAEDVRSAAIREVAECLRQRRRNVAHADIRECFPEAFSGAVNAKDTDDEC